MFHTNRLKVLTITLVCALLLSGCAVRLGDPPLIDRLRPFLRLAVTLGTDRILTKNQDAAPMVVRVTSTLMALFAPNVTLSVPQMEISVRTRLSAMTLTDEERAIIEALLQSVLLELRLVLTNSDIPDHQVTVYAREMIGWIYDVALRHMQAPVGPKKVRN